MIHNVFDDITDPIMLIDENGLHSYSNKAAKTLSISNDISMIGSRDFQQSLHQILDKEIDTPIVLQLNDDLGIGSDFEVKIMPFKSFFMLHFISHDKNHIGILKHRLLLLLKDELEKPLNDLYFSSELLMESIRDIKISNKIKELLNNTLEKGSGLMDSIFKIKILSDLYTDQDIQDKQKIPVLSLLNVAIESLETLIKKKSLSLNIETTSSEVNNILYGSKNCLLLSVTESIRQVVGYAKDKDEIKVKVHLNGYFATIKISNTPVLNPLSFHQLKQEGNQFKRPLYDDVENSLNFDLFLAHRIIKLHGGNLKQITSNGYNSIIVELPLGSTNDVNELDGLMQAKVYAADLARIKTELTMKNSKDF